MLRAVSRPPTKLREEILDAAIALLRRDGERAMTQTSVAREVGIPQGHLTYYFPKKRDLVLGVAARFAELSSADMLTFFSERRDVPVREALLAYAVGLTRDRERTRMVLGLLVMSEGEPQLAKILERNASGLRSMLAPILDLEPHDPVVDLMLALLWGLGIHEFVLRENKTESLTRLAFSLIEKKS